MDPRNDELKELIDVYETELIRLHEIYIRGVMVLTRATSIAEGEKNTPNFFNLEKRNFDKKHITKLYVDGRLVIEPKNISFEKKNFYELLYSTIQTEKENNEFYWGEYDSSVLEEEYAVLCEGPITEAECFESVMFMPNDKTPESDGLSVNFYKVFWQELKDYLCQVFNKCFENGELCPSIRRGVIITLLPKQGQDNLCLKFGSQFPY